MFSFRKKVSEHPSIAVVRQLEAITEDEARREIVKYGRADIKRAWADDPYTRNYFLNLWECETQQDVLESYPWNVALPIADLCNARCTFCTSWLRGKSFLSFDALGMYADVLPYARLIGIQGHGEPLANPEIDEILRGVSALVDRRAQGYIITNGAFLGKLLPLLLSSRITVFNVSLNAATEKTHDIVMGLGRNKLAPILDSIREIVRIRDSERPEIQATISIVLTADNVHEAADFVRLGNELRVDRIYVRTLMPSGDFLPPGLNYHLLSPILNSEFDQHATQIRAAIESSTVPVETQSETWATDVVSPAYRAQLSAAPPAVVQRSAATKDRSVRTYYDIEGVYRTENGELGERYEDVHDLHDNPYGRKAPFGCRFVYQNLITTQLNFHIHPCCYMDDVPGHRPLILSRDHPFMTYWNSEALVGLRRRLRNGPLYQACAKCPMQG